MSDWCDMVNFDSYQLFVCFRVVLLIFLVRSRFCCCCLTAVI